MKTLFSLCQFFSPLIADASSSDVRIHWKQGRVLVSFVTRWDFVANHYLCVLWILRAKSWWLLSFVKARDKCCVFSLCVFLHMWKVNSKGCSFYICLWNKYHILQTGTSSDDGLILLDFPQFCGKNVFQVMKVNFLIIQFPITKQSCLISLILLKEMLFKIWKFGLCPTWKSRCNFPQFSLWIWQGTKIFQSRSNNSGNLFKNINIL